MKNFFLIFSSESSIEEKTKLDIILSKTHIHLSGEGLLGKIVMAETNDYKLVKKMINSLKNKKAIGNIIVIDDSRYTCFIHKANGCEDQIRKDILPNLLKVYELSHENGHWFGKVVDARCVSNTKMAN